MSRRPQSWQPSGGTSGAYKDPIVRQLDSTAPKYSLPAENSGSHSRTSGATTYSQGPGLSMGPPAATKSLSSAKSMSSLENNRNNQPQLLPHSGGSTSRLFKAGINPSQSWHSGGNLSSMGTSEPISNGLSIAPDHVQAGLQHYGSESKINATTPHKTVYPYTGSSVNLQTSNNYKQQQYTNPTRTNITNNIRNYNSNSEYHNDREQPPATSSPTYVNLGYTISEHDQYKPPHHPPPPPVRDASSYFKKPNHHSKSSSCPAESGEQLKMKHSSKKTERNDRKTWSSSNTKSSEDFPAKAQNNVLSRFGESEEDDESGKPSVITHMKDNSHQPQYRANFIGKPSASRVDHTTSRYGGTHHNGSSQGSVKYKDRDGRAPHDKDYSLPSPPERDSDIQLEEMLQNAKDRLNTTDSSLTTPSESSSGHSPVPHTLLARNSLLLTEQPRVPDPSRTAYTMATSGQHSAYNYTPYYNTGTQTQDALQRRNDRRAHLPNIPPPEEIVPEITYRNAEVQVDMDIVTITPAPTPVSTLDRRKIRKSEMGTQFDGNSSPKDNSPPGISHDDYNRIMNDRSSNDSSIMRQLSREFYQQQTMKQQNVGYPSAKLQGHNRRSLPDAKILLDEKRDKQINQSRANVRNSYDSPKNSENYANINVDTTAKSSHNHYESINKQYMPSSHLQRTTPNKDSIKKAYGVYEDTGSSVAPPLGKPHDNLYNSNVRDNRGEILFDVAPIPENGSESVLSTPLSPTRLGNYTVYSQDVDSVQRSEAARNSLRRTTSEQIKPNKVRTQEQHNRRSADLQTVNMSDDDVGQSAQRRLANKPEVNVQKHSGRMQHKLSDPAVPSYPAPCKSDPKHRYPSDPSYPFGRQMSNPYDHEQSRLSDGQFDKRLSTISTADSGILSVRSSSSGSIDQSGITHDTSDIKRTQHDIAQNFYESKTNKRMSSSSMDSSLGSGRTTPRSERNSLAGYGMSPNTSQNYSSGTSPMSKSVSLPRDLAPPPMNNKQPTSSNPGSRAKESLKNIISNPLGMFHKKGKSVPSALDHLAVAEPQSENVVVEKNVNAEKNVHIAHDKHPRALSAGPEVQTHDPHIQSPRSSRGSYMADDVFETSPLSPRLQYDRQDSSGTSGSSPSASTQQISNYQITENRAYREDDEELPAAPPTLPPRNYRPGRPNSAGARINKLPPAEPPQSPSDDNNWNTPKADNYAEQLRVQMRRLSEQQGHPLSRGLLNKPGHSVTNSASTKPIMPTAQDLKSSSHVGSSHVGSTFYEQRAPDSRLLSTPNRHQPYTNSSPDSSFGPVGPHDSGSNHVGSSVPTPPSPRPGSNGNSRSSSKSNLYVNEDPMASTLAHTPPQHQPAQKQSHTQNDRHASDTYIATRGNITRQGFNGNYIRSDNTSPQHSPSQPAHVITSVNPPRNETIQVNKPESITPPHLQHRRAGSPTEITDSPSVKSFVDSYEQSTDKVHSYGRPSHRQEQLMRASKENLFWTETDLDDVLAKKKSKTPADPRFSTVSNTTVQSTQHNNASHGYQATSSWTVSDTKKSISYVKVDHHGNQPVQPTPVMKKNLENYMERKPSSDQYMSVHNSSITNGTIDTSNHSATHTGLHVSPASNSLVLNDSPPNRPPPSPPTATTTQSSHIHVQLNNPMTITQTSDVPSAQVRRSSPDHSQSNQHENSPILPPKLRSRPQTTDQSAHATTTNGATTPPKASPTNVTPLVPQVVHVRQKSAEEIEYERHAQKLTQQLGEEDKQFCEVIAPSSQLKTSNDFMTGIFDTQVDLEHHSILMPNLKVSPRRGSGSRKFKLTLQDQPLTTEELKDPAAAIRKQKEDLIKRLQLKIETLKEDQEVIESDIGSNEQLGTKVTAIVKDKCKTEFEFKKYQRYVDDMEQVMLLLLNLSSQLARAENKLLDLPGNTTEKEKLSLEQEQERIKERHNCAKEMKTTIDVKKQQVATYLCKYLPAQEYEDYEHYIKMKSRLKMELHEIEFKISQSDEQLEAVQESLDTSDS